MTDKEMEETGAEESQRSYRRTYILTERTESL